MAFISKSERSSHVVTIYLYNSSLVKLTSVCYWFGIDLCLATYNLATSPISSCIAVTKSFIDRKQLPVLLLITECTGKTQLVAVMVSISSDFSKTVTVDLLSQLYVDSMGSNSFPLEHQTNYLVAGCKFLPPLFLQVSNDKRLFSLYASQIGNIIASRLVSL